MSTTTPDLTPVPSSSVGSVEPQKWAVPAALATVYVIWGSTYLALKWMIEGLPPLLGAGSRYLLAGAVLYAVVRVRGGRAPTAKEWLASLPAGALLFTVGNGFVTLAERDVSSSVAAVVCATMPLLLAGLGVFAGERISRREAAGLLIGFAGVAVMTAHELIGASLSASLILLAPVGWSLGTMAARKLPQAPGLGGAAAQMITGGVVTLIAGALHGEHLPTSEVPGRAIGAFFYLVVVGSLVAFSAYSYLLRNTRPSIATSYAYVNPVIAMLLGVVVGGEKLGAPTILGGVLVIAAVVVVVRSRGRKAGASR